MAVQRGIIINSGNTYLHQVLETVGQDSAWAHHYRQAVGIEQERSSASSAEERGIAALRLYQETVQLLQPYLSPEHLTAIEPLLSLIDQVKGKKIT